MYSQHMPIKISNVKNKFTKKQIYPYGKIKWSTKISNMSIRWCIYSSVTREMQSAWRHHFHHHHQ